MFFYVMAVTSSEYLVCFSKSFSAFHTICCCFSQSSGWPHTDVKFGFLLAPNGPSAAHFALVSLFPLQSAWHARIQLQYFGPSIGLNRKFVPRSCVVLIYFRPAWQWRISKVSVTISALIGCPSVSKHFNLSVCDEYQDVFFHLKPSAPAAPTPRRWFLTP